jgi:hypothetical protein
VFLTGAELWTDFLTDEQWVFDFDLVLGIWCGSSMCAAVSLSNSVEVVGGAATPVAISSFAVVSSVACSVGFCHAAINGGESVQTWGDFTPYPDTTGPSSVGVISCGYTMCAALRRDHTAKFWNEDTSAIVYNDVALVACRRNFCWYIQHNSSGGRLHTSALVLIAEEPDIQTIECSTYHCVSLKTDGTVRFSSAPGAPTNGFHLPDVPLHSVKSISCGDDRCVAVRAGWGAVAWGEDDSGIDLSAVVTAQCGGQFCMGITKEGSVKGWGGFAAAVFNNGDLLDAAVSVTCGGYGCGVLHADGTAYSVNSLSGFVHTANVQSIQCEDNACWAIRGPLREYFPQ